MSDSDSAPQMTADEIGFTAFRGDFDEVVEALEAKPELLFEIVDEEENRTLLSILVGEAKSLYALELAIATDKAKALALSDNEQNTIIHTIVMGCGGRCFGTKTRIDRVKAMLATVKEAAGEEEYAQLCQKGDNEGTRPIELVAKYWADVTLLTALIEAGLAANEADAESLKTTAGANQQSEMIAQMDAQADEQEEESDKSFECTKLLRCHEEKLFELAYARHGALEDSAKADLLSAAIESGLPKALAALLKDNAPLLNVEGVAKAAVAVTDTKTKSPEKAKAVAQIVFNKIEECAGLKGLRQAFALAIPDDEMEGIEAGNIPSDMGGWGPSDTDSDSPGFAGAVWKWPFGNCTTEVSAAVLDVIAATLSKCATQNDVDALVAVEKYDNGMRKLVAVAKGEETFGVPKAKQKVRLLQESSHIVAIAFQSLL